jgi:hypothetical protein
LSSDNRNLRLIKDDIPVNKRLELSGIAEPGDIVKLRWTLNKKAREMFFVYINEESFPDSSEKRSFFIYPYRTQLEYNTFPARKHSEYMEYQAKKFDLSLDSLGERTDGDSQHGGLRWLVRDSLGLVTSTVIPTSAANGTGRATVFRSTISSADPTFAIEERPGLRSGADVYALVDVIQPVGIESDFLRQSVVAKKRGKSRISIGKIREPGVFFVSARMTSDKVITVPVIVVREAGDQTFSVSTAPFSELTVPQSPKLQQELIRLRELQSTKAAMQRWKSAVKNVDWTKFFAGEAVGKGAQVVVCMTVAVGSGGTMGPVCVVWIIGASVDFANNVAVEIIKQYHQEAFADGLITSRQELANLNSVVTSAGGAVGVVTGSTVSRVVSLVATSAEIVNERSVTTSDGKDLTLVIKALKAGADQTQFILEFAK